MQSGGPKDHEVFAQDDMPRGCYISRLSEFLLAPQAKQISP